jgi:hypothetical protein
MHGWELLAIQSESEKYHPLLKRILKMLETFKDIHSVFIKYDFHGIPIKIYIVSFGERQEIECQVVLGNNRTEGKTQRLPIRFLNQFCDLLDYKPQTFAYLRLDKWYDAETNQEIKG